MGHLFNLYNKCMAFDWFDFVLYHKTQCKSRYSCEIESAKVIIVLIIFAKLHVLL